MHSWFAPLHSPRQGSAPESAPPAPEEPPLLADPALPDDPALPAEPPAEPALPDEPPLADEPLVPPVWLVPPVPPEPAPDVPPVPVSSDPQPPAMAASTKPTKTHVFAVIGITLEKARFLDVRDARRFDAATHRRVCHKRRQPRTAPKCGISPLDLRLLESASEGRSTRLRPCFGGTGPCTGKGLSCCLNPIRRKA
jgi:hypothetical protein